MTEHKIAPTNDVAQILNEINSLYTQGKIKGFTAQIVNTDGEFITTHCGDLSYLEKLGLIESAKQTITLSANELV